MENISGTWVGKLEGPVNRGSMVIELSHVTGNHLAVSDPVFGKSVFISKENFA